MEAGPSLPTSRRARHGGDQLRNETVQAEVSLVGISRRAADRLREGHLWVYRSDLLPTATGAEPEPGAIVTVVDGRRIALGSGMYSSASEIAVRMISDRAGLGRAELLGLVRERIAEAIRLREELAPLTERDDARRLVFGEADALPGLVVDQYNDLLVVQLLTQAMAADDVRAVLALALAEAFRGRGGTVLERADARVRELERIAATTGDGVLAVVPMAADGDRAGDENVLPALVPADRHGAVAARLETVFTIGGLRFHYDSRAGQKTGAFLDQRLNYQAAASHARGRALDVCTYHGGFALHLARRCERVTGVDASRAALEVADRNLQLNLESGSDDAGSRLAAEVDWIEADAFDLLRAFQAAREPFDTVVLDPPAFAKSRRAAEGAMRGYKELNLRAMQLLRTGGTLVTCSCSHHVSSAMFQEVVREAAVDAGRRVQVLELRGAAPDHPAMVTLAETSYLKCLICRVG